MVRWTRGLCRTSRFTGVHVPPAEPRLVIGEGARDGERIALDELLRLRLEAGYDWPR